MKVAYVLIICTCDSKIMLVSCNILKNYGIKDKVLNVNQDSGSGSF